MISDSIIIDIQRSVERMDVMLERLDTSIEKLTEVSQSISKLLAVHEEKLGQQEKINANFTSILEQRRMEMDKKTEGIWDEIKDIRHEQTKQYEKLNQKFTKIEKFIWTIGGGGAVLAFLLTYGPDFIKLIK